VNNYFKKNIRVIQLPLGPRVTPTAFASFSTPAWRDFLEFWSNAMSLAAALTTKFLRALILPLERPFFSKSKQIYKSAWKFNREYWTKSKGE
jgi:hypothetical protein